MQVSNFVSLKASKIGQQNSRDGQTRNQQDMIGRTFHFHFKYDRLQPIRDIQITFTAVPGYRKRNLSFCRLLYQSE